MTRILSITNSDDEDVFESAFHSLTNANTNNISQRGKPILLTKDIAKTKKGCYDMALKGHYPLVS